MGARTMSILATPIIKMSSPLPGEPMELTTPTNPVMSVSTSKSHEGDAQIDGASDSHQLGSRKPEQPSVDILMQPPVAAAAAIHQPKIVQTAFIHKLYNMLEDKTIQHLISWTPSSESFVVMPSHEFSKVLASYFKHTNISSFVRQLNMYGFHKVSDVFHNGAPDSTMWEFKHGNGNFKRGDLLGLREIKRRASRQALVHRPEYANNLKSVLVQPGTSAEHTTSMQDGGDPRLVHIESAIYDLGSRLQRSEEQNYFLMVRQHAAMDTVTRLLQVNRDLSRALIALAPGPENRIHQDVAGLQDEIERQMETLRSLEEPHEPPYTNSRAFLSRIDNAPVSPRQMPHDDPRRSNAAAPQARPANDYRPPVPSNLSFSSRRSYGSIGASQSSPSSLRTQPPQAPPGPRPPSNIELPPHLARRHTSADIHASSWQTIHPPSHSSGPASSQWPSTPQRVPSDGEQRLQESFSKYFLQAAARPNSRPITPPPPLFSNGKTADTFGSWSWNQVNNRENRNLTVQDSSVPPTRRGSMAHILNPTDSSDRDEDDLDPRGDDDRKRKRLQ